MNSSVKIEARHVPIGAKCIWLFCGCEAQRVESDGQPRFRVHHRCLVRQKTVSYIARKDQMVGYDPLVSELEVAFGA